MNSYKVSFNNLFECQLTKLKHSMIWLIIIGIPVTSVLIGSGNYLINQQALHGNPWINLWTQIALFYGYFFYPISISIVAAYLWRLEHYGTNWNQLKTLPVNSSTVWLTNFFVLFLIALLIQIVMLTSYWFMGMFILKFSNPIPLNIWWYLIAGPICAMASGSIQLYLSLRIKSFSAPIAICFFCCFIGLYLYMKGFWIFPQTLAIIGINAQHATLPTIAETVKVLFGTFLWTIISSTLGIHYLNKMEP